MKRLSFAALLIVAVCLLAGCPPQKPPSVDICPGVAHCAVLTWKGTDIEKAYRIYRGNYDGKNCMITSESVIATVPLIPRSYIDVAVASGQSYCYEVEAFNDSGETRTAPASISIP